MSRPRPWVVAGVWLAGTVLATGTGLLAVRTVATQVGDPTAPVLRGDDVAQALDAPGDAIPAPAASGGGGPMPSSPAVPSPAPSPSPAPASPGPAAAGRAPASSAPATFRSSGGTAGVQCVGAAARLLFATPALGYALEQRGASGSTVTVRFEAGASRSRLRVGCATGRPVLIESRDDSRGGGGGSDGGDSRDDDSGGSNGSGRDEPREDDRGSDDEDG